MTSFFTGRYIQHHGVLSNKLRRNESIVGMVELLPGDYRKAAFVCNGFLSRPFGYRGCDAGKHILTTQKQITGQAIEYLDGMDCDERFFLWLHYIDPHGAYTPPEEFDKFVGDEFYDPSRKVNLKYVPHEGFNPNYVLFGQSAVPQYIREGNIDLVDYYIAKYDGETRYTDEEVGKILEYLESKDLLNCSIVIITADHGESLGENGYYFDHGALVNESSIHIPLIIGHPEIEEPLRIDSLLQNIDLAPTLLSEFDLKFPCQIDGLDFSELYRNSRLRRGGIIEKELRAYIYSCTPNGYPHFYETIRTNKGKLIRDFAVRQIGEDLGTYSERIDDKDKYRFYTISEGKPDADDIISSVSKEDLREYFERIIHFGLGNKIASNAVGYDKLDTETQDRLKGLGYI
jgi:arylsulfatase A-like enzyme